MLGVLNQFYNSLEKKDRPQIIFITVDPDRDTLPVITKYLNAFNKNFIGVRTSAEKTVLLENQFHIIAKKIENSYSHTADLILINPHAEIQAYFSFPANPSQLKKDYLAILNKK